MPPESNVESTLIWYDASKENQHTYWVNEIESFINGGCSFNFQLDFLLNFLLLQHTKPFQQQTNKNALSNMVLDTEKSVKPTSTPLDHAPRTTNMDMVETVPACSSS